MGFVISFSFHVYISMLIVAIAIGAWSEGAVQGRLYWNRDELENWGGLARSLNIGVGNLLFICLAQVKGDSRYLSSWGEATFMGTGKRKLFAWPCSVTPPLKEWEWELISHKTDWLVYKL